VGERVAVLGAAGYAGAVASALLHRHPHFELAHVTARADAGARLDEPLLSSPLKTSHARTTTPITAAAIAPRRTRPL
jgi:N-acetyl-gamma-glutamylphosphate reductase